MDYLKAIYLTWNLKMAKTTYLQTMNVAMLPLWILTLYYRVKMSKAVTLTLKSVTAALTLNLAPKKPHLCKGVLTRDKSLHQLPIIIVYSLIYLPGIFGKEKYLLQSVAWMSQAKAALKTLLWSTLDSDNLSRAIACPISYPASSSFNNYLYNIFLKIYYFYIIFLKFIV